MSFVLSDQLPEELWSHGMIHMPTALTAVYRDLLCEYNLMREAESLDEVKGSVGGITREETLDHLAFRFGVSVCRMESVVVDPHKAFASIPIDLQTTFFDGRVSILDAPSGTGAAGTSILATIASLRLAGLMPKLPLTVSITAGDLSPTALEIYEEVLQRMDQTLRDVGIIALFRGQHWDAFRPEQTSVLVDRWFENSMEAEEHLAVVANFSGAAADLSEPLQRSFQHLHERLYSRPSTVLWVEPGKMTGARKLAKKIRDLCRRCLPWFVSAAEAPLEHEYTWYHPFQKRPLPCRVMVQQFVKTMGSRHET